MQYTICSRGKPIGITDLGFRYKPRGRRMGWFHPNEHGEKVMEVVRELLPATEAFVRALRHEGADRPSDPQAARRRAEYADIAAAEQHVDALDFTLHREDGSIVPTEAISFRDIEQLMQLRPLSAPDEEPLPWEDDYEDFDESDISPELQAAIDHDLAIIDEWFDDEPWTPEEDLAPLPRYQVHVEFDGNAIP